MRQAFVFAILAVALAVAMLRAHNEDSLSRQHCVVTGGEVVEDGLHWECERGDVHRGASVRR